MLNFHIFIITSDVIQIFDSIFDSTFFDTQGDTDWHRFEIET